MSQKPINASKSINIQIILWIGMVLLGNFVLSSCHQQPNKRLTKAFYYWKTDFHLTAFEQKKLDSFNCHTLYVRFFDVSWNDDAGEPKPIAMSLVNRNRPDSYNYIPVIFITQEVMSKIKTEDLANFVKHFTQLLYEKCIQANIEPAEIQIDCDWTQSTEAKYFQLLRLSKAQPFFKDKTLSCTIRLHQVRYPKISGIPPVDKGLLMCYNMGNLKLAGDNNSILDLSVAKKYVIHLQDYPLNLDIAFPLFSWSLLYDDKNRFAGILREVTEKELNNTQLFEPAGKHLYKVKMDTLWKGYTLKRTFTIRHESCSPEDLNQLAGLITGRAHGISTLIFYHLDSLTLTKYSNHELEKIYHSIL